MCSSDLIHVVEVIKLARDEAAHGEAMLADEVPEGIAMPGEHFVNRGVERVGVVVHARGVCHAMRNLTRGKCAVSGGITSPSARRAFPPRRISMAPPASASF